MAEIQQKLSGIDLEDAGLAQKISHALLQAILDRKLRGGDRLVETELQKRFKVSRSPLREALRDLENKGLVVIKPRRGTFVKKITRNDIDDHYPVQASLEGLAARQAATRLIPKECRELELQLVAMEKAAASGDTKSFLEHHGIFHTVYIEGSRNLLLIDMIMKLRLRGIRFRYFFPHNPGVLPAKPGHTSPHKRRDLFPRTQSRPWWRELVRGHIEEMVTMDGWEL